MCGNWITDPIGTAEKAVSNPLDTLEHYGVNALGFVEGGPVGLAATESGYETAKQGGSVGDILENAAISGGEAYIGQQAVGGLSNAFPETASSIYNMVPNLGINDTMSEIRGALPDLGIGSTLDSITGGITDAANSVGNSLGLTSTTEPGAGGIPSSGGSAPINANTGAITGGTGAGAGATPAGIGPLNTGDVTNFDLSGNTTTSTTPFSSTMPSGSQDVFPQTGTDSMLDSSAGSSATAQGGANITGSTQGLASDVPQNQGAVFPAASTPVSAVASDMGATQMPSSTSTGTTNANLGGSYNFNINGNPVNTGVGTVNTNLGANIGLSDMGSNVATGGSTGSTMGDAINYLSGGSNTPSPGTIAANNATFNSLQSDFPALATSSPVAGGATSTAAATGPSSISEIMADPTSGKGWGDLVTRNPGAILSGLGLGAAALKQAGLLGNNTPKGQNQVEQIAGAENSQGQVLTQYLQNGTLPPGMQTGIDNMTQAAKAQIKSRFASMGMSGSSAEQQELAQVDANAQAQAATIAQQLLTTGIGEENSASGMYQALMKNTIADDASLSSAFTNFASSLGGGGSNSGITVNVTKPTTSG